MARTQGATGRKVRGYSPAVARWVDEDGLSEYTGPMPDAPQVMRDLERLYLDRIATTVEIVACMAYEGSRDGRGTVTSRHGVNATTVTASDRPRVRDSHDARPASERGSARPYSPATFTADVEYGRSPARLCGDAETFTVPVWFVSLLDGAALTADTRTAALKPFTRTTFSKPDEDSNERKDSKPRTVSIADERSARLRAIAGTIRMGDQD